MILFTSNKVFFYVDRAFHVEDCGSLSSSCERGGVIKLCKPPAGSRLRGARNRTEPKP